MGLSFSQVPSPRSLLPPQLAFLLDQRFSNFSVIKIWDSSLNPRELRSISRVGDSEGLEWALRIHIPGKFPDDPK